MKPWLRVLLILVIVAALGAGGVWIYAHFAGNTPVEVTPIEYWTLHYMPNDTYIYGIAVSDESLSLSKETERTVEEVFVHEGDTVHVGDPLARYDATMDNLKLEEKLLEREKLLSTLQQDYAEYKRWARADYERTIPSPTPMPTPTPRGYTGTAQRMGEEMTVIRLHSGVYRALSTRPSGGTGTSSDPYQYTLDDGDPIPAAFIKALKDKAAEETRPVYAELKAIKSTVLLCAEPDGALSFSVTAEDPNPLQPNFDTPVSTRSDGSEQNPFVFLYASGATVPAAFLDRLSRRAQTNLTDVYATLLANGFSASMKFTPDGGSAMYITITPVTYTVTFNADGGKPAPKQQTVVDGEKAIKPENDPVKAGYTFIEWQKDGKTYDFSAAVKEDLKLKAVYEPIETETPGTPEPTPYYGGGWGPSKAEREEYARQAAQRIREGENQYRQLTLDIQKLQMNGADGIVYSTIEGTVTKAVDPEAVQTGETFLEVRGGTGLHLVSVIGEMNLDQYPVGTVLNGFSYESGSEVTVRITEIGTMPISTNWSNGGNPSSSGYMARMDFIGDFTPRNGEYIEFSSWTPNADRDHNYLHEAYIREIDGQDCVFLVRDDVLQKVPVKTGKRMDEYIEILDLNLSDETYIAFPYDKNAKDGAPVKYPSESAGIYY